MWKMEEKYLMTIWMKNQLKSHKILLLAGKGEEILPLRRKGTSGICLQKCLLRKKRKRYFHIPFSYLGILLIEQLRSFDNLGI